MTPLPTVNCHPERSASRAARDEHEVEGSMQFSFCHFLLRRLPRPGIPRNLSSRAKPELREAHYVVTTRPQMKCHPERSASRAARDDFFFCSCNSGNQSSARSFQVGFMLTISANHDKYWWSCAALPSSPVAYALTGSVGVPALNCWAISPAALTMASTVERVKIDSVSVVARLKSFFNRSHDLR